MFEMLVTRLCDFLAEVVEILGAIINETSELRPVNRFLCCRLQ